MASISSKKLLPSTEKKEKVFLVPYTNIIPSTPKLGGVKPTEGKKETVKTSEVNEKLSEVVKFFRYSLLLKERDKRRKRREQERKRFEESESKLETRKLGKKQQQEKLAAKIPGSTIFDRLARFTGFTLLGFVFNNFSNLLPGLNSIGSVLAPAAKGIGLFADSLFEGVVDWIDKGYKAYDAVGKIVKDLGGENYERLFNEFSGALNLVVNGALLAGAAGLRGGLFKPKTTITATLKEARGGLGGATAAGRLSREMQQQILSSTIKKRTDVISKRGKVRDLNARTRFKLKSAKTKAQQEAIAEDLRESDFESGKGKRTRGFGTDLAAGEKGAFTDLSRRPTRKILKAERDLLRKVTIGGFGGVEETRTLVQKVFDTKREKFVKLRKKSTKGVPITETVDEFFEDEMFRAPTEQKRRITKKSEIKNIKKGQPVFSPKTGKRTVELAIPGLGRKRFNPAVADTLEYMAKTYGTKDMSLVAAFEDPDFYGDIIATERRAMLRAKGKRMTSRPLKPTAVKLQPRGVDIPTQQAAKTAARTAGRGSRIIPFIGPLFDFVLSVALGDPPGEAAAGAIGAALGGFVGTALVGAGTFGLGAIIGGAIGGFVGDLIGRALYKASSKMLGFKKDKKGYNQGGVVASRQIKRETKPKGDAIKTVSPVGLQSRFSEKDLKTLYGDSVGILGKISGIMASPGGFIGSIMSSSINLLFGQKFDDRLLSYIGKTFGRGVESNVRSSVDTAVRNLELFLAFGKDSQQTKLVRTPKRTRTFMRGPAPGDALERRQGETPRPADLDPSIPMADDIYVFPDGSILKPGMEVGSLQMTPTYAKHMEFTYAIQPVMVG